MHKHLFIQIYQGYSTTFGVTDLSSEWFIRHSDFVNDTHMPYNHLKTCFAVDLCLAFWFILTASREQNGKRQKKKKIEERCILSVDKTTCEENSCTILCCRNAEIHVRHSRTLATIRSSYWQQIRLLLHISHLLWCISSFIGRPGNLSMLAVNWVGMRCSRLRWLIWHTKSWRHCLHTDALDP